MRIYLLLFAVLLFSCSNYKKKKALLEDIQIQKTLVNLERDLYDVPKAKKDSDQYILDSLELEYKARYE